MKNPRMFKCCWILGLILTSTVSFARECPLIHLNLDLNGTVIWDDPAGEKDIKEGVEAAFAKTKRHAQKWSEDGPVIPLNDHLKGMRRPEKKDAISKWLDSTPHRETVDSILKDVSRSLNGASEEESAVIFPSVLALFDFLVEQSIDFQVTLRTFGTDGPRVASSLSRALSAKIKTHVTFRNATFAGENTLNVEGVDNPIEGHAAIADFIHRERFLTIQDDYKPWGKPVSGPREHWKNGKKFYFESDPKVLALFFDDNANFLDNSLGEDIVCPIDRAGKKVRPDTIYGRHVFQVSTMEAGTDPKYFIDLVLPLLRSFPDCL